jgi:hypothetical protein
MKLVEYLEMMIAFMTVDKKLVGGRKYFGEYDFLLANGVEFKKTVKVDRDLGEMGECYANAGRIALMEDEWTYVEGLAFLPGLIPMSHAWLVNDAGEIWDPTWEYEAETEYFGVAFNTEYLRKTIMETEYWGLLGWGTNDALMEGADDFAA